jgi:N-acetylneuraminic acid mutarotase
VLARSTVLLVLLAVACEEAEPIGIGPPWRETMMPDRRLEAAATALGTRLVVYGGFTTGLAEGLMITNEVMALDTLDGGDWDRLPPAPVAWTHANLAASGGSLYLLGGLEGTAFEARGESFVLGPGATEWKPLPAMPMGQERGAAAVVVSPGHIFLIGGASSTGVLGNTLDFDLTSRTWSIAPFPDLPMPRSHAAAMRESDGTFVVAGGLGELGPLGDTFTLPLGATAWQLAEPMPTPRAGCAYGVVYGQLVCAGGDDGTMALRVVESYDPNENEWTARPDMPEPRSGARGAVVGQQLYVPGGAVSLELEPTASLFVFSAVDTEPAR